MEAVVGELNYIYSNKDYRDPMAMEIERTKLLYMLYGYNWMYSDRDDKVITREQKFTMPLLNPKSGRALPNVKLVGMLDKLVRCEDGTVAIKEHKSTSNSLDSDSNYWGHLTLDTQTKLYLYAARRMQKEGLLAPWGIKETDRPINKILYDVAHKPTIKPKLLTQAESKQFVEDGEYSGQTFIVLFPPVEVGGGCRVDGTTAEIEPGKKDGTFAIRETPEMYGARLLADIGERPDFYFRCIEISRSDREMEAFEWELCNIYRTMQTMIKTDQWYGNEHQCEAKYKCDYIGPCYNGVELSVDNVPEGMKCIFDSEES